MSEQFFYLTPDTLLHDFIDRCKGIARGICGTQQYLDDSPHLTLYVGDFNYSEALYQAVGRELSKIGSVGIEGWTRFMDDPVTGGHTLVLEVSSDGLEKLKKLQCDIVQATRPFRRQATLERYRDTSRFSEVMLENLQRHGFPFVGEIWRAHYTIASFEKQAFEAVWQKLKELNPPTKSTVDLLSFVAIHPDGFENLHQWRMR